MHLSATTMIHNDVRNTAGDDLGNVEDLMIDTNSGKVEYAVVSFGGFLGIGDKLFAIPLEVLAVNTDDKCFVLNESKDRLEKAPGFDKDHWPNHGDPKWRNSIRSYYNLDA